MNLPVDTRCVECGHEDKQTSDNNRKCSECGGSTIVINF